jgi:hypothetical protein
VQQIDLMATDLALELGLSAGLAHSRAKVA